MGAHQSWYSLRKKYLLGTSAARPLLAKGLTEVALAEGADAVAHGCTGKGNDQVRFELGVKAFAPEMEVIAPWRIWDIQSREEEIAYLEARHIPVPMKKSDSYSRDDNLWHISHEGLDLEDPSNEPHYEGMLKMCVTPEKAPDKPEYVTLGFEYGVPVSINGEKLDPVSIVRKLNKIGGANGVGIVDMVENRVVGMKSRGVYETPGGTIIMEAHDRLEQLCLDKKTLSFKMTVAQRFAEILYEGEWFSPLCTALRAFIDSTQDVVTGQVTLKLYKGNMVLPVRNLPIRSMMQVLQALLLGLCFHTAIRQASSISSVYRQRSGRDSMSELRSMDKPPLPTSSNQEIRAILPMREIDILWGNCGKQAKMESSIR